MSSPERERTIDQRSFVAAGVFAAASLFLFHAAEQDRITSSSEPRTHVESSPDVERIQLGCQGWIETNIDPLSQIPVPLDGSGEVPSYFSMASAISTCVQEANPEARCMPLRGIGWYQQACFSQDPESEGGIILVTDSESEVSWLNRSPYDLEEGVVEVAAPRLRGLLEEKVPLHTETVSFGAVNQMKEVMQKTCDAVVELIDTDPCEIESANLCDGTEDYRLRAADHLRDLSERQDELLGDLNQWGFDSRESGLSLGFEYQGEAEDVRVFIKPEIQIPGNGLGADYHQYGEGIIRGLDDWTVPTEQILSFDLKGEGVQSMGTVNSFEELLDELERRTSEDYERPILQPPPSDLFNKKP